MLYLRPSLLLLFFVVWSAGLVAQNVASRADSLGPFTIPAIDTWKIHSSTIGEDYTLYVLRTARYDTSGEKLPVLYMTDGDWNMTVAMNCFSMLRQDYTTHEPLVVGIGYGKNENKRVRDLDPRTGGPAFLHFIEKEVMPFINSTYRTTQEKAIYGYSLGGMFTTYILFNRPGLFNKVFIGAPGNNGRELMPAARAYFKDHTDLKGQVFVGVGSFEHETSMNIDSFTHYLLSKKCSSLDLRSEIAPNANHGAALAQVMQNAIAFAYCERHKAVKLNTSVLNRYTGTYTSIDNTQPDATVYVRAGKLYAKWNIPGSFPNELVPQSKNEFFMVEVEQLLFTFAQESGKKTMVVTTADHAVYRFTEK